jgi:hypothetical protein
MCCGSDKTAHAFIQACSPSKCLLAGRRAVLRCPPAAPPSLVQHRLGGPLLPLAHGDKREVPRLWAAPVRAREGLDLLGGGVAGEQDEEDGRGAVGVCGGGVGVSMCIGGSRQGARALEPIGGHGRQAPPPAQRPRLLLSASTVAGSNASCFAYRGPMTPSQYACGAGARALAVGAKHAARSKRARARARAPSTPKYKHKKRAPAARW